MRETKRGRGEEERAKADSRALTSAKDSLRERGEKRGRESKRKKKSRSQASLRELLSIVLQAIALFASFVSSVLIL